MRQTGGRGVKSVEYDWPGNTSELFKSNFTTVLTANETSVLIPEETLLAFFSLWSRLVVWLREMLTCTPRILNFLIFLGLSSSPPGKKPLWAIFTYKSQLVLFSPWFHDRNIFLWFFWSRLICQYFQFVHIYEGVTEVQNNVNFIRLEKQRRDSQRASTLVVHC